MAFGATRLLSQFVHEPIQGSGGVGLAAVAHALGQKYDFAYRTDVIRDGLVVKEEDDPEIYVYQDGQFRWISSLDAFEHFGYTWGDVHIVDDGYLDRFEMGTPLHVLLKCYDSPHVYRLEEGVKRWIVDIKTFEAEGHVWDDVDLVSCGYLRDLPDGETIPPGSGPPP